MPRSSPPLRDRVLDVVRDHPWLSSQEVANRVGSVYGSTSSLLLRLVREEVLIRTDGCGPRKGWGYAYPGTPPPEANLPWKKTKRPVQDIIYETLERHPWYTVAELADVTGKNHGSVYAALLRLIKDGRAQARDGCGSRGGMGYAVTSEQGVRVKGQYIIRRTLWEHLED